MTALLASPLQLLAACFGLIGIILLIAALVALKRRRPFRFILRTLFGLLLLSLAALAGVIGIGMQGYRALTREEVAARVVVQPLGPQRFSATFHIPGRPEAIYYELAGDAIYVDAHILKWKPIVNVLGLHTAYELDRVAGRYNDVEQERSSPRTVHTLTPERRVDLFGLRTRYAFLAPLLDAEYGSGTFVRVTVPSEFEIFVSTTGLLIRPVSAQDR
jgi:hypothetical protein